MRIVHVQDIDTAHFTFCFVIVESQVRLYESIALLYFIYNYIYTSTLALNGIKLDGSI
jgi:hypothetical protein